MLATFFNIYPVIFANTNFFYQRCIFSIDSNFHTHGLDDKNYPVSFTIFKCPHLIIVRTIRTYITRWQPLCF